MDQNLKNEPLVSIMMTTYNRADYTRLAILSILAQSYQNWELLVLDDCSSDNTGEMVAGYSTNDARIKYLPAPENLGITKNRNRGFEFANGKYIAILDCDDIWTDPEKLKAQVTFLESNPEYVVVGTGVDIINHVGDKIGSLRYFTEDTDIRRKMLGRNQFTHSATLIRAEALPSRRPYDESGAVSIWEDYDLFLRLGLNGKLANLPENMTAYRVHDSNISKEHRRSGALAHLDIIKRYNEHYPGYYLALLKGYLRLVLAWI